MFDWTDNEAAGLLPFLLSIHDKANAAEQLMVDEDTVFWTHPENFTLLRNSDGSYGLVPPGRMSLLERSRTYLRGETIILFECDYVAIEQQSGAFRVVGME
jgi:hypothetical protein